jgi:hypothetical protein
MMNVKTHAAETETTTPVFPGVQEEVQNLDRTHKLLEHEQIIEVGLTNFEVGRALRAICDAKLYKGKWEKFEPYCKDRWDMSPKHAYRLIKTANVMDALKGDKAVKVYPLNEAQIRPIAALLESKWVDAWKLVIKKAGTDKITARLIASVIANRPGRPKARKAKAPKKANSTGSLTKVSNWIKERIDEEDGTVEDYRELLLKIQKEIQKHLQPS